VKKILDVGCGNHKMPGATGIDISIGTHADIIHDLNRRPWPFNDNSFDEIICNDIIEHLDDVVGVMEELHRIGKSGALVRIRVPHFSSHNSFGDVTHKHLFNSNAFDVFCQQNATQNHYFSKRFKKCRVCLRFGKLYALLAPLINLRRESYERYFAFVIPAGNIELTLQVEKE